MNKKPYRHGDVIVIPVEAKPNEAKQLDHKTLAWGEVTGHSHQMLDGSVALFKYDEKTYLEITSEYSTLSHEEHHALKIPKGTYEIVIQREYDDENEWRQVYD